MSTNALRIFVNNGEILQKEKGDFFVILKYSKTQKLTGVEPNTLTPEWNQEIVFPMSGADQRLEVSLYSQDYNCSDVLVGTCLIQNPESYVEKTQKTINVLNAQNQITGRINLDIWAGGGRMTEPTPPARKGKLIHIIVEKAKIFSIWDESQFGDPFAVVTYNNFQATTRIKVNRKRVVWREHFVFHAVRSGSKQLEVAVWDKDLRSEDELIGSAYIDDTDISVTKSRRLYNLISKREEGKVEGNVTVTVWLEYAEGESADPDATPATDGSTGLWSSSSSSSYSASFSSSSSSSFSFSSSSRHAAPPDSPMKPRSLAFPQESVSVTSPLAAEPLTPPSSERQKDGFGVLVDTNSRYEGNIRNGLPHGKGTCVYANGAKYEGDWVNGLCHGDGVCRYVGGVIYEGRWLKDKKHGHGTQTWPEGYKYVGEWVRGKQEGKGTYYFPNGSKYEGDWVDDKQHGKGKYTWGNGQEYIGDWVNDQKEGHGFMKYVTGETYEGEWRKDVQQGQGKRTWPSGQTYVGENANNKRDGKGVQVDKEGRVVFEGLWKNGVPVNDE